MKTKIISILALLLTVTQGAWAQGSWNYDYTGAVQSFTAPYEGTYTLEAWGAQGGNWVKTGRDPGVGGKGGYASGTVTLAKNQTIYIYVGGKGATTENQQSGGAGGWNGGGTGGNSVSSEGNYVGAGGGGGASHVSLSNAQVIGTDVNTLSGTNYLIVAGGGGGAVTWTARAGAGGGTEGGAGATTGGTSLSPWYNSTLSTGRNGNNAVDYSSYSAEGTGGGGGGYLGGNAGTVTSGTSNQDCGGCGGSSNYNSTYVSNFTTTSNVREGAGKVTITFLSGEGTEDSPYLIASTTDWNNLVSAVNGGETYSGTYFKMTANVGTVSTWMTGDLTTTGIFSGHFDGGGHTLTVNYSSDTQYCHPFGFLRGATIENLHVTGNITTSQTYAAGLASRALSNSTNYITNCLVSTNITSTRSGTANICGVVMSVQANATLYIEGCAFTGSITSSNGTDNGGFSEWVTAGGTFSATNCLFAPSSVTDNSLVNSATFCRNGGTFTGCYFTRTLGTAQGIQARTIAAGDYVTTLSVTKGAATVTYDVSGITVYSGGIDFNDGSTTTFYGGSGQTVSLALTAETRDGYRFKQYAASQGTLSGQTTNTPTLNMPAANSTANDAVTISAEYTKNEVTLTDGDDLSALSAYVGEQCDVTYLRSFTADKPSTVCLPFAYTPKSGETFYTFTGINEDGGNYTADMTEVVSPLVANTPYLFMPTGDADFSGTYAIPDPLTAGTTTTTSGDWTFKGTYSTIEWTDAPEDPTYGFSAQDANDGITQGQFVKVGSYVRIKPMRAYLEYNGSDSQFTNARSLTRAAATTSDDTLPETIGVRLISANGEVTAIGTLYTRTGEVSFDSEAWYTLDGKRLNAKPNTKGIYVNNGKKVVVK